MVNRLLLAVSIVALTAGGAFAQNSYQSPGSSSAPSSSMPSQGSGGMPDTGTMKHPSGATGQPSAGEHSSQSGSSSSDQSGSGSMDQGSMGQAGSGMSESHSAMTGKSGNVKEAQQTLKDQGLYKGKVDGKIGPQTKSALAQFQKQNGLKQTAQLDHPTMKALMQSNSGSSGGNMGGSSGGNMGGSSSGNMGGSSSGTTSQ